ncbi:family A1 protease [Rhodofomes roseus]|uniref:Family A1 protease n=1 Tax=Rhodofomes roseus TaxID=34475 RepID=A0ABQ8KCC0_9APHY|nr:family A1 protease [Rhodofomes roseus]KAH9834745.1 family A1 protease [Rhodofomes roseus]
MKLTAAPVLLALAWLRPSQAAPTPDLPLGLDMLAGSMSPPAQASKVTLPFARRVGYASSNNIVQFDQARAQFLRDRAQGKYVGVSSATEAASAVNVDATSRIVSYTANVQIGDPPTNYSLLIDTGSSNTWAGANMSNPYVFSETTVVTPNTVFVSYGSGFFGGVEVMDQISLGPELTITMQGLGAALVSSGFDGVDGIMGIGPQDLTCGTQLPGLNECVPTVVDNAWKQGLLEAYEIGISFTPSTTQAEMNGELTFGGIDERKYKGTLNYVNITSTSPASHYVGIEQTVTYGGTEILSPTAGIIDTGTTLLLLATNAFDAYQNMTGATMDQTTGLLQIDEEQYEALESLYFSIGDTVYEFTPDAQLWPRSLNEYIGGDPDGIYLIVSDNGAVAGSGLDFINGMGWLERFYTVYDVGNSRVGFATTSHTHSKSNFRTN